MKKITRLIIAAVAMILLCSFIRPQKVQRRRGVLTQDEKGKVTFKPLEDWQDYKIKSTGDTVYQFKIL